MNSYSNFNIIQKSNFINLGSLNLNLEGNNIGDDGAKYLSSSISKITNLGSLTLTLTLINNNIVEVGAKDLSSSISKMTKLRTLSLTLINNKIGEVGAKDLSR